MVGLVVFNMKTKTDKLVVNTCHMFLINKIVFDNDRIDLRQEVRLKVFEYVENCTFTITKHMTINKQLPPVVKFSK